jgi:hypothetical protein
MPMRYMTDAAVTTHQPRRSFGPVGFLLGQGQQQHRAEQREQHHRAEQRHEDGGAHQAALPPESAARTSERRQRGQRGSG